MRDFERNKDHISEQGTRSFKAGEQFLKGTSI